MELHYYRSERGNFGDDLNPQFFEAVCPDYKKIKGNKLIGIGTLLNGSINSLNDSIVFGSGYGQGNPANVGAQIKILGVRGPLTAMSIGHDPAGSIVMGDPALLLPKLPGFNNGIAATNKKYVIALHHRTAEFWDFRNAGGGSFYYLDPALKPLNSYIETIKQADLVLAESLHAAILAAAYGIPFIRVKLLGIVDETKWLDFYLSLKIDSLPIPLALPTPGRRPSRRLLLGLISRNKVPQSTFKYLYSPLSESRIDAIESHAMRAIDLGRLTVAPTKQLELLQGRIAKAAEILLSMPRR